MRRLREVSLLTRFGVTGLILTAVLGVALAEVLSGAIAQRAREQAEWTVITSVRLGLQSQLAPADLANGFPPERLAAIEKAVHASAGMLHQDGRRLSDLDPVELNIYNMATTVVYSDDHRRIGTTDPSPQVRRALRGEVVSGFATDTSDARSNGDRRLLEVYVPLQYEGVDAPEGVVELYLPYAPVAAAVSHDVRMLVVALTIGLATFLTVMFRVVAGASRRLRRQARELKVSAESNRHQATHDALTGLPNRVLVKDRLEQALAAAARKAGQTAVLLIGLDRFKEINETLGHSYGDQLLCQIGPRLREALREADTVARLGGDEFAVLVPVVEGVAEARAIAARLGSALHQPFDVDGVTLDVEASIGIAMSPWHGSESEELLRNADIAMYAAKQVKAGAVMFRPEEHETSPARLSVFGDLRRALDHDGELYLNYQPKFTLDGEHIEGAEALLRWNHPERGLISPAEFIPFAEGTGIILRLTEHVLGLALAQMRRWLDAGLAAPIAVNLSTRCLLDPRLPELVGGLLAEHGVPAHLLRLEVTESAVMGETTRCLAVLEQLHELGVKLSLDDFGTGYSSMAHLRRLPVDELKIDASFVLGMTSSQQDAVLVRTAVDLGHNLGLTVVAEGVESADHVDALRVLGADIAQGFFFARPMPTEDFTALLGRVPVLGSRPAPSDV